MRKNCEAVYAAWHAGHAHHAAPAIWTDGTTIYSYTTAIVTRPDAESLMPIPAERVVVNRTRYSPTTSIHQSALLSRIVSDWGAWPTIVTDLPFGATAGDLREAARHATAA